MRKVLCCAGAIAGAVVLVGASAASADQYVVVYEAGREHRRRPPGDPRRGRHDRQREHRRRRGDRPVERPALREQGRRQVGARTARRATAPSATRRASVDKPSWRDVESERGNFHGNGPRPRPVSGDPLGGAAVGHAAHRRHADGLLRPRSGQPRRPRRDHGHGRRRQAPRHRAELRPLPEPQLHDRQLRAGHRRRPVRAPELRRSRRRGRRRPRHARGQHDRLAAQRHSAWPASPRRSTS